MNRDSHNNIAFAFMKLEKEVRGVKHAFVFSRLNSGNSQNNLENSLRYLVSSLSKPSAPVKIFIQAFKGEVIVCTTEIFFLGAVLSRDANPTLVEMILTRIASSLDSYFESFKAERMETLEKKIEERIESLCDTVTSVIVTLGLKTLEVTGEIKVIVPSPDDGELLKREIHNILCEEIPFFYNKKISVEIRRNSQLYLAYWI
jgi:hypothetical protein